MCNFMHMGHVELQQIRFFLHTAGQTCLIAHTFKSKLSSYSDYVWLLYRFTYPYRCDSTFAQLCFIKQWSLATRVIRTILANWKSASHTYGKCSYLCISSKEIPLQSHSYLIRFLQKTWSERKPYYIPWMLMEKQKWIKHFLDNGAPVSHVLVPLVTDTKDAGGWQHQCQV